MPLKQRSKMDNLKVLLSEAGLRRKQLDRSFYENRAKGKSPLDSWDIEEEEEITKLGDEAMEIRNRIIRSRFHFTKEQWP